MLVVTLNARRARAPARGTIARNAGCGDRSSRLQRMQHRNRLPYSDAPGDYLREPDFSAGAWRGSAVASGGLRSLVDLAAETLRAQATRR